MDVDLQDAREKLRWAKKHFEDLRAGIEPFEARDAHRIWCEVDEEAGRYDFYVSGLQSPDPNWGLMIGDCLHNARTALDYVMVRLVSVITGEDPIDIDWVQFPIYDDPKRLDGATAGLKKNLALRGYVARIEELQPFNARNPSIWGIDAHDPPLPVALERLSLLDNIDKHRVVHATWNGIRAFSVRDVEAPSDFTFTGGGTILDPLKDGAKVGEWFFDTPLPSRWAPTEVQMKRHFPLQVAFPDPLPVQGVLDILPRCLWAVEAVIAIFDPVFNGKPPLPVTAVGASKLG